MGLTAEENFIEAVELLHGVSITTEELKGYNKIITHQHQQLCRINYRARNSSDYWGINGGPTNGKVLSVGLKVVAGFAAGGWLGAALALAGGLLGGLGKKKDKPEDEKFNQSAGIESGGALAPAGRILPLVYGSRSMDPNGGVRVGGALIHSRIETLLGTNTVFMLYALSAGQSPTLGWGQLGQIDDSQALFNKQPRSNFTAREITGYTREGTQRQTAIAEFPFYSQSLSPPDYSVFGVDQRAKVDDVVGLEPENTSNITNATVVGGTITGTGPDGWNSGVFSTVGVLDGGFLSFTANQLGPERAAGLSNADTDLSWVSIEHGFYFTGTNFYVIEVGILRTAPIPYNAGDSFSVNIINGVPNFLVNGNTVYISAITPALPLFADIAFFTAGGQFTNVVTASQSGGIGGGTAGGSIFTVPKDDFELFDPAEDYTVCDQGSPELDQVFSITAKDKDSRRITADKPLSLNGGDRLFAFWEAKYEDTKRVSRTDFNFVMRVSARDDEEGRLKVHGIMFDLYMRSINDPLGSEVLVQRFYVRSKNPSDIRRGIRIKNKRLGRYFHKFVPLCRPICDDRNVYELTDSGNLTTINTGVVIEGQEIQIEGEFNLVYGATAAPSWPGWSNVRQDLIDNGDGSLTYNPQPGHLNRNPCAELNNLAPGSIIYFGCPDPGFNGSFYLYTASDDCRVPIVNGQLIDPNSPNDDPLPCTGEIELRPDGVYMSGSPIDPGTGCGVGDQIIFNLEVCVDSGTSPALTIAIPDQRCDELADEMTYDDKTQVSSEQGPTARIGSVNEIVEPSVSLNPSDGLPNRYRGIALQGYKFLGSERLRQAPGTRTLVREGRTSPNFMAAGAASLMSTPSTLSDPTADFSNVQLGWFIRNTTLDPKTVEVSLSGTTHLDFLNNHAFIVGDFIDVYLTDGDITAPVVVSGRYQVVAVPTTSRVDLSLVSGDSLIPSLFGSARIAKFDQILTKTQNTITTTVPLQWTEKDEYVIYLEGSSALLADIFGDLVANDLGGLASLLNPDDYLHYPSLVYSREFCRVNNFYWNGVIEDAQSFAQFTTKEAVSSRLMPVKIDGKFGLLPDELKAPEIVFNSSNCKDVSETWREWTETINNKLILRYTDGRDVFQQDGARFRLKTITIWTREAYDGLEQVRETSLDLKYVSSPEQAIAIGTTYLKGSRLHDREVSFTTGYHAAYLSATDYILFSHPTLETGEELSGFVRKAGTYSGGVQRVILDCEPCLVVGEASAANTLGLFDTKSDFTKTDAIAGDLLINTCTGDQAVITQVNQNSLEAAIEFREKDTYKVLNLTPPVDMLASVTYRADGSAQKDLSFTFVIEDDEVWVEIIGLSQPLMALDPVNIGTEERLYRIQKITPQEQSKFRIDAISHPGEYLYTREGLVIEYDDYVLKY